MNVKRLFTIMLSISILAGCNQQNTPAPAVVAQGYSLIVSRSGQLANEYSGSSFDLAAGDSANLGLKINYSDGTKQLIPASGIYWSITTAQTNATLTSNQLRGILVGTYDLSATFDPSIVKNAPSNNFKINFNVTPSVADHLQIAAGDNQTGLVSNQLNQKISVKVLDVFGNAVSNATVTFYQANSTTVLSTIQSDLYGLASIDYSLSQISGTQIIKAEIGNFVKKSVNFTATAVASDAVSLSFKTKPTSSLAGQIFGTPVTVAAQDQYGNDVLIDSRDVTLSASLSSTCDVSNVVNQLVTQSPTIHSSNGLANFPNTYYKKAEVFYLKAVASGLTTACSGPVIISPNVPSALQFVNIPSTTIKAGAAFPATLTVNLVDNLGNIVNNQSELAIALGTYIDPGCSVPALNPAIAAKTTVLGSAYFPGFSLSLAQATYIKSSTTYQATGISSCSPVINVSPAIPTQIVFSNYPSQAIAGVTFSTTIITKDSYGNQSPYYESALAANIYTDALCSVPALGLATYSNPLPYFNNGTLNLSVSYTKAEPIYLKVYTADFSACSTVISVKANSPYKIAFVNQPARYNGVIGKFLTDIPQVSVKDIYNNNTSDSTGVVSILPYSDSQCLTQTLGGSFTGSPANVIGGSAIFTNLSYTTTDTIYFKAAYTNGSSTFFDCSNSATFNPDLTNVFLSFETQPVDTAVAGSFFSRMPVISIKDGFGNYVSPAGSVSLSSYLDSNCSTNFKSTGKLSATSQPFINGRSSFTDVVYNKSEVIYLKASYGNIFKCSSAISVLGSAINSVAFLNVPQNAQAGVPFTPFSVITQDLLGNVINSGSVSIQAFSNSNCTVGVTGNFTSPAVSIAQGFANLTNVNYDKIGQIYLKAIYSDSSYTVPSDCSTAINVKAGSPDGIIMSISSPATAKATAEFAIQPQVRLIDQYENLTESFGTATFGYYSDSSCVVPSGFSFSSDVVNGISQNPHILIGALGSYYLKASVPLANKIASLCSPTPTLVQSLFTATMAKTTGKSGESLPITLNSEAPVQCFVSDDLASFNPGGISSIIGASLAGDCKSFTLGNNTGLIPYIQNLFIRDSFNQSTTFKVFTVPLLRATFAKTNLASKEQSTVTVIPPTGVTCSLTTSIGSIMSPDCTIYQAGANYTGSIAHDTITYSDSYGQTVPVVTSVQPDTIVGGKLTQSGTTGFGASVSVYGNYMAVGDPLDNGGCGAVYIYKDNYGYKDQSFWTFQAKIIPSACKNNISFGSSVSLTSTSLAVGAPGDPGSGSANVSNAGAVYTYSLVSGAFIQEFILREATLTTNSKFGTAVSVSNGFLAASAPGANLNQGKAYVYNLSNSLINTWTLNTALTPPAGIKLFGSSVSIYYGYNINKNNGFLAVGASGDNSTSGSVFVYTNANNGAFSTSTSFSSPDSATGDLFGSAVAVFGPYLAVGSPGKDSKGAAYIYKNITASFGWAQTTLDIWSNPVKIQPSTLSSAANFGASISLFGNYLAVGAPTQASLGALVPTVGSTFIYQRLDNQPYSQNNANSWTQALEITSANVSSTASFGTSVALSNNRIAVGSNTNMISTFAGNWILNTWPFGYDGPITLTTGSNGTVFATNTMDYSSITVPSGSTLNIDSGTLVRANGSILWTFLGSKNDINLNGTIQAINSTLTGSVSSSSINDDGTFNGPVITGTIQNQLFGGKGGDSSTSGLFANGTTGGAGGGGSGGNGGSGGGNGIPIVIRTNGNLVGSGVIDVSGANGGSGGNGSAGVSTPAQTQTQTRSCSVEVY